MPRYAFKAHDLNAARQVSGTVDAPDQMRAIAALKNHGCLPIEIRIATGGKAMGGRTSGTTAGDPGTTMRFRQIDNDSFIISLGFVLVQVGLFTAFLWFKHLAWYWIALPPVIGACCIIVQATMTVTIRCEPDGQVALTCASIISKDVYAFNLKDVERYYYSSGSFHISCHGKMHSLPINPHFGFKLGMRMDDLRFRMFGITTTPL